MGKKRNIRYYVATTVAIASLVSSVLNAKAAVAVPCPQCTTGKVSQYTSRVYEHDETFPCSEHKKGYDLYAAYEVTVRRSCNSCSYSTSNKYTEHVFLSCHGID